MNGSSAISMSNLGTQLQPSTKEQEEQLVSRSYKSKDWEIRTRYDETIQNLESVFERSQIFYGFYETMFTVASIKSLCEFLEIQFFQPDFEHYTNVSRTEHQIDTKLLGEIYSHYEPVYAFAAKKFGAKFIGSIWPERND
jgi:hypothetical protein